MLVWVTGLSGTGKSSVAQRLRELGHRAVDADDDGLSGWRNHATGEIVPSLPAEERPPEWLDQHAWSIDVPRVQELRERAAADLVFLVGAVANEAEILALADLVVCLVADAATLRRRLERRDTNDFGKAPGDIDAVLSWLGTFEDSHRAIGAVMVDATQPLSSVVDDILTATGAAS